MMIDCRISEATAAIRARIGDQIPHAAIILGSGLGGIASRIENPRSISFAAIPHFACSTAEGHRGEVVAGQFGEEKTPVVALAGRLHRYEGWSLDQVTFPVAVLAALGAQVLIVSNAAGGLNAHFQVGDIMVLRDHINMLPCSARDRPLPSTIPPGAAQDSGASHNSGASHIAQLHGYRGCGPSLATPYDPELACTAIAAARRAGFAAYGGTYLATLGPNYETRAEYRMMRRIGADAVGMSTVPEVLEAGRRGMRVLALSMISNLAFPNLVQPIDHQHVLEAGQRAEPKLRQIIEEVLRTLA